MKINYNYHTHTRRCGHAVGTDEEYVVNAIKAGIKILGFSDHAPYKEPNPSERMNYNQYGDYVASIEHLREKYKDQIKILLGLEIEYFPSQIEDLVSYRNKMDYLILGQHMSEIDGRNNYYIKKPQDLIEYAEALESACNIGLVDVIAHPDLFMFGYPKWDSHCERATNIIIDACLANDVALELNCGGIKYGDLVYEDGDRPAYPHPKFFEIVKERNCPIVLGLDTHDPAHFLDDKWVNNTLAIVKDLDLNILSEYDILESANSKKKKIFNY